MTITNNNPGDTIDVSAMALPNTDMIMMQFASPTGAQLTGNTTPDNANIQIDSNPSGIQANDVLMISDCETVDILRANNVSDPDGSNPKYTIAHSTSTNTVNKLSKSYPPGAQIMSLESNLYFVGPSGRASDATYTYTNSRGNTVNSLYRVDINGSLSEVAQGVDAMVLLYGEKLSSGYTRYYSANNAGLNLANVDSIKVGLLMHTIEGISDETDAVTYDVAGTDFAPSGSVSYDSSDHRIRRVFTTTVNLRNRR